MLKLALEFAAALGQDRRFPGLRRRPVQLRQLWRQHLRAAQLRHGHGRHKDGPAGGRPQVVVLDRLPGDAGRPPGDGGEVGGEQPVPVARRREAAAPDAAAAVADPPGGDEDRGPGGGALAKVLLFPLGPRAGERGRVNSFSVRCL